MSDPLDSYSADELRDIAKAADMACFHYFECETLCGEFEASMKKLRGLLPYFRTMDARDAALSRK